jgi:hypothetical protein
VVPDREVSDAHDESIRRQDCIAQLDDAVVERIR